MLNYGAHTAINVLRKTSMHKTKLPVHKICQLTIYWRHYFYVWALVFHFSQLQFVPATLDHLLLLCLKAEAIIFSQARHSNLPGLRKAFFFFPRFWWICPSGIGGRRCWSMRGCTRYKKHLPRKRIAQLDIRHQQVPLKQNDERIGTPDFLRKIP